MTYILSFIIAFGVAAIVGQLLIPLLRRLKAGQSIRADGPTWHMSKQGTPTMGGIMFILAIGGIFSSDFGLFYQVSQGAQQPLTPVVATLDVKVYQMLTSGTISLGKTSAASLFQAVVGCITILTANAIVRKVDRASALI